MCDGTGANFSPITSVSLSNCHSNNPPSIPSSGAGTSPLLTVSVPMDSISPHHNRETERERGILQECPSKFLRKARGWIICKCTTMQSLQVAMRMENTLCYKWMTAGYLEIWSPHFELPRLCLLTRHSTNLLLQSSGTRVSWFFGAQRVRNLMKAVQRICRLRIRR